MTNPLNLVGESFYKLIQEKCGMYVEKVLRYHDIDSYLLLGDADEREIIDTIEKANDSTSSSDLLRLKSELCNVLEGKVSMKIGTKN